MADFAYQRLARQLARELLGAAWRDGAQLPSEARLCERYGVSRATLRRALDDLSAQGLLLRGQGRRARVASPVLEKTLNDLGDFHSAAAEQGRTARTRVLDWAPAQGNLQTDVFFADAAPPWRLLRRRAIDRRAVLYQRVYLPGDIGAALRRSDFDDASLYGLLRDRLARPVHATRDTISATGAPDAVADALAIDPGAVVIQADRLGSDRDGQVLEISRAWILPDHFRFVANASS